MPLDEDKDSIETFLEGFELRARLASDDQDPWVLWLGQVFCKGKVGEVYCRAATDPNTTYAEIKEALLAHFHITREKYRRFDEAFDHAVFQIIVSLF
jgi:hypothetical protein